MHSYMLKYCGYLSISSASFYHMYSQDTCLCLPCQSMLYVDLIIVICNFFILQLAFILTTGKSGIHGFGIFAKHPHRAGDMVK